jgi:hypothetical protein
MKMSEKATKKQRSLRSAPRRPSITDSLPNIVEISDRINVARENLRALVEQVAVYSGAADEDLISQRIAVHSEQAWIG